VSGAAAPEPAVVAPAGVIVSEPGNIPGVVIRKFSDDAINKAIGNALALIPEGQTGAVVAYANLSGAKVVLAKQFGDQWSVVMAVAKDWQSADLTAEAAVRFSWR